MDTSKRLKSPRQRPASSKTEPASTTTRSSSAPRGRAPRKAASAQAPTHQQIAERAYLIHLSRGGHHGSAADDWLQAERELTAALRPAAPRRKSKP